MKTFPALPATRWITCIPGLLLLLAISTAPLRAGLTVDIHLFNSHGTYFCYPYLSTNDTPPDFPIGDYAIAAPQAPTNGPVLYYRAGSGTFGRVLRKLIPER